MLGMTGLFSPGLILTAAAKNKKTYKAVQTAGNEVFVPLSLFEESNIQIVSVKGWEYDMAVHKQDDGNFSVFLLRCTHMDNAVQLSSEGFVCSMHGSTYDKSGNVTKGPAEKPLEQYHAAIIEDHLVITP